MKSLIDIQRWSRLLILAIAALLFLSACNSSSSALTQNEAGKAKNEYVDCWQKDAFNPIYDVIGETVMNMYDDLSAGAMTMVMIGFAVWVALRLLKFVSSVTEDSPAEIWNEIIRKAFICLFCGTLASSSTMLLYTINILLFPIYEAFLTFGSNVLALSDKTANSVTVLSETISLSDGGISCAITPGETEATLKGFPTGIKDMMGCMVCAVAERMKLGRSIAWVAMTQGGIMPFIVGGLVWLMFFVVSCSFVFYLVDSLFRFGMMILLLPILILAYAFGPTKKWTGIGFENIMNSAAFMMAFSIIVAMVLTALVTLINDNAYIFNPTADQEQAAKFLQDFSIVMMCLLLIGFLVLGSMDVAQQLTSAIIGGKAEGSFQKNLTALAKLGVGGIKNLFGGALNKTGFFQKTKLGRALKAGGALKNGLDDLAGRK